MSENDIKAARMQSYAKAIELDLQSAFDCERFSMGGVVDSDYIQKVGFIPAIVLLLSKKYIHTGNRKVIDDFLNDIKDYAGVSMDALEESVVEDILATLKKIKKQIN